MADDHRTAQQALPPHRQLMQMGSAYRISRILYAAAKLGLADQLASGPRSALGHDDVRNAVLFLLDELVEYGSSTAYKLRDDFVTPSE